MRYWFDTEFIEDGATIDLISIGIVAEDGRELYAQRASAKFKEGKDWLWRNVYPHLQHFDFRTASRSCKRNQIESTLVDVHGGRCSEYRYCSWYTDIRSMVRDFCDPEQYGKPEFWGYYADYDWVALCQMYGNMDRLPKGWPMYCRDIKQWCDDLGNPQLPPQENFEHHALADAKWNKYAWEFLQAKAEVQ
jgi:hypothetical protein